MNVSGSSDEALLRVDLAAAFRLTAQFGWHESVGNHYSAAVSQDGRSFLMNPRWRHFSLVRASELLLLEADDDSAMHGAHAPDPAAWGLHSTIHALVPSARVLLHCHPPNATVLAGLADPSIKPIDQITARFFERLAIDRGFAGFVDDTSESERLAGVFGNHSAMLMGNHGVTVTGATVAEAFEDLYYLERACTLMVKAYATGQPLNVMSDTVAREVAESWDAYRGQAFAHFEQLKQRLDRDDPSYRD